MQLSHQMQKKKKSKIVCAKTGMLSGTDFVGVGSFGVIFCVFVCFFFCTHNFAV